MDETKEERKIDREESKAYQAKLDAERKEMMAKLDDNTEAKLATKEDMEADRTQRKAEMEEMLSKMEERIAANQAKTDAKFKELTETVEKTQLELQTAEVSLDARTRKLREDLTETKHELQARLEAVEMRTERGNTPAVGASANPPPTFNGRSTLWSVFRRQFEIVAEHNRWSNREKSTYLITALKGRRRTCYPESQQIRLTRIPFRHYRTVSVTNTLPLLTAAN
jgi:hypothetical protein